MTVIFHWAQTALECHSCSLPNDCLKQKTDVCGPGQDTCQRSHTVKYDKDAPKEILVWERLCTTASECEKAKRRNRRLIVTCCKEPKCNL
ncbi:hypothetical protein XENTR_v10023655 [Xenopus tropicalis]|nr:hypothetical protein XENTR_v10023655 [Xenopus tropicalis]